MVEAAPSSPGSSPDNDSPAAGGTHRMSGSGVAAESPSSHSGGTSAGTAAAPEDSFSVATAPAPRIRQHTVVAQKVLSNASDHPAAPYTERVLTLVQDPENPDAPPTLQINTNVTIPQIPDAELSLEHDLTAAEAIQLSQIQNEGISLFLDKERQGNLFTKRPQNALGLETEQGHSNTDPLGEDASTRYGTPAYVGPAINRIAKILFKPELSPTSDSEALRQIEEDPLLRGKLLAESLCHCFRFSATEPGAAKYNNLYAKAAIFVLDEIIGAYRGTELTGKKIAGYRDEIIEDLTSGDPQRYSDAEALLAKVLNSETTRRRRPLDITGEFGADQSEGGSRIFGASIEDQRVELTNDQQLQRAVLTILGAEHRTRPTPSGTTPAKTAEQHLRKHITPHARYDALLRVGRKIRDPQGMYPDEYRAPISISYHGEEWSDDAVQTEAFFDPAAQRLVLMDHQTGNTKTFSGIDSSIESQSTSMQVHVEVDSADKFVPLARTADIVSPLLKALAANAPTFLGVQGVQDCRSWGWLSLDYNHWDISRPDGSGAGNDWVANELSQLIEHSRSHKWMLPVNDAVTKSSSTKGESPEAIAMRTALEATKTFWPENRATFLAREDGTYEARVEARGASKGPMPAHDAAIAAFLEAMVEELPAYLEDTYGIDLSAPNEELNKHFPYAYVKQNRRQAEGFGIHDHMKWPGPDGTIRTVPIREVIEELLPLLETGMGKRAYDKVDYRHLVGSEDHPGVIRRLCSYTLPSDLRDSVRTLLTERLDEFAPEMPLGQERDALLEAFRSSPDSFTQKQADRLASLYDEEQSIKRVLGTIDQRGFSMADISQLIYHGNVILEPARPEVMRSRDLSHYHVLMHDQIEHHYYDEHMRLMKLEGHTIDERPKPEPYDVHNHFLLPYVDLLRINLEARKQAAATTVN
ncbi:MAG: hypothetical protein KDD55_05305 [Bdellovibrionales bacterium]|nr:hypothetical protein [Bdellovibrionales bacterium]